MSEGFDDFELDMAPAAADRLTLDLDGWEGPLDLLLTLARTQKVDLAKISILALVEQYLAFIADAKKLKLEIAADYLVMAAWLAFLKSCLLLPKDPGVDPSPEELAMRLQLRLQRLQAMREAGARLIARDRLGRDVFRRRAPEGLKIVRRAAWRADLYDLISAYGIVRARTEPSIHVIARRPVMTLDEAIHRLERMLGARIEWTALESFLPETQDEEYRKSALASSFVATLELARLGKVVLRQKETFSTALCEGGMRELDDVLRAVEAVLFAAEEPLGEAEIALHLGAGADVAAALAALQGHYAGRGVELVERGGRWHFQTAADLAYILRREREESRAPEPRRGRDAGDHRLSRAGQPRRDRGDPRRADLQGHAGRADGGGLGAARRAGARCRAGRSPTRPRPIS